MAYLKQEPGKPSCEVTSLGTFRLGTEMGGSGYQLWSGSNGEFYLTCEYHGEDSFYRPWDLVSPERLRKYLPMLETH